MKPVELPGCPIHNDGVIVGMGGFIGAHREFNISGR